MRKKLLAGLGAAIIFLTGSTVDAAADNRAWDLDAMINPTLRDDFSKMQPHDYTDVEGRRRALTIDPSTL